jgi:hypothetical protein
LRLERSELSKIASFSYKAISLPILRDCTTISS